MCFVCLCLLLMFQMVQHLRDENVIKLVSGVKLTDNLITADCDQGL